MPGLRRLSLNHNPKIGDKGIQTLVSEARSDIWLRAVDLQNTGLTDVGGRHLVHLVRNNPNLSVVDARNNPGMSNNCASKIMAILAVNNADKTDGSKYKWLQCQAAGGDSKTTVSLIPRLETCIPKLKKGSTFLVSKSQKDFTATRRVTEDWLADENKFLLLQVEELNRILGSEITLKSEIMQKNCYLIHALEHCQMEKKELEQRLVKMEKIVRQLTDECGKRSLFPHSSVTNFGMQVSSLGLREPTSMTHRVLEKGREEDLSDKLRRKLKKEKQLKENFETKL